MDYVIWLLAASGIVPPPPAVLDTVRVLAAQEAPAEARDSSRALPLAALPADGWTRWRPAPFAPTAPAPQRPQAIEYSDLYNLRLKIHSAASFATIPLFAAQYVLGQKLYRGTASEGERNLHRAAAAGVAGLFAVNTVTGAWNLWDSRKDPNGRTRRWLHAGLMWAANAGFVATGATAPETEGSESEGNPRLHRALAVSSMGVALASYLMMLVWKD